VTTDTTARPSALVLLQTAIFFAGMALLIASTVFHTAWLPLIAGPCIALSGVLLLVGVRITFAGPVGDLLRTVLGSTSVRRAQLRAALWITIGVAVSVWGLQRLRAAHDTDPTLWEGPLVQTR
jgi:hypothetical protein